MAARSDLFFRTMDACKDGDKQQYESFCDQVTANRPILFEFRKISYEGKVYEFAAMQYAAFYDILDCFKFLDKYYEFFKDLLDNVSFNFSFYNFISF